MDFMDFFVFSYWDAARSPYASTRAVFGLENIQRELRRLKHDHRRRVDAHQQTLCCTLAAASPGCSFTAAPCWAELLGTALR